MDLRSGYPFWLIKNGLPFSYERLTTDRKTDVVILGGGISGALSAYALTEAGFQCLVVDARSIALGSTCASTALLQYEIDVPLITLSRMIGKEQARYAYQSCARAVNEIIALADKIQFAACKPKTSLYFAAWKKDLAWLHAEYEARKAAGFDVRFIDQDIILQQFGFQAWGGIHSGCGAGIDAYMFTHALLQHILLKGAEVYDRSPIVNISHQQNGVKLQTANGHILRAKKIVYATGYEVTELIEKKVVTLQATYATISEEIDPGLQMQNEDVLIWNTAKPYLYMRTTDDRRILIGGRDESFYSAAKRDHLIKKKSKQLQADYHRLFPETRFVPEFSWTGTFGSTHDGLPFIGRYPKLPHGFFALGFGGNGITFSVIAARMITELMLGKKNSSHDHIFSFDR